MFTLIRDNVERVTLDSNMRDKLILEGFKLLEVEPLEEVKTETKNKARGAK